MKKPSILIATPCYGGMLTYSYVNSLLATVGMFSREGFPHGTFMLANESLIPRGRNRCAHYALKQGYDKLLFIDADISWDPMQVKTLLNCNKAVVGGTYPVKSYPLYYALNALDKDRDLVPGTTRTAENIKKLFSHYKGLKCVPVAHLPTGFLLIDVKEVLEPLKFNVPKYNVQTEDGFTEQGWDFFPSGPEAGTYMSEDWGFCELVTRHLDCGIWLAPVSVSHTGTHTFRAEPLI